MSYDQNPTKSESITDGGKYEPEMPWAFSDSSPFVHLLEKRGRVKILDTLIRRHASKLTAEQIAEQGDISESTFSRHKDFLLDLDIMVAHEDGTTTRYQINKGNEVVQLLAEFHTELLNHTDEILERSDAHQIEPLKRALRLSQEIRGLDDRIEQSESDDKDISLIGGKNA